MFTVRRDALPSFFSELNGAEYGQILRRGEWFYDKFSEGKLLEIAPHFEEMGGILAEHRSEIPLSLMQAAEIYMVGVAARAVRLEKQVAVVTVAASIANSRTPQSAYLSR